MAISYRKIFNDYHPIVKIVFDLVLMMMFTLVGIFLIALISKMNTFEVNSDKYNIVTTLSQGVSQIFIFLLPALLISLLYSGDIKSFFNIRKVSFTASFGIVMLIFLLIQPLVVILSETNSLLSFPDSLKSIEQSLRDLEDAAKEMTNRMLSVNTFDRYLLNLFVFAMLPAIGEELFFRGLLQKHVIELTKNYHWGILITALVFSGIHFQFFTFLPRVLLGIVLGYLFVWAKSIWLPAFAHFLNNALAVTMFYIATVYGINQESIENFDINIVTIILTIVCTAVFVYLMYFLNKTFKKLNE